MPSASKEMVAATVRTIFAQPDAEATKAQLHDVVGNLQPRFAKTAELLEAARRSGCHGVLVVSSGSLAHDRLDRPNPSRASTKSVKRCSVVGNRLGASW